MSKPGSEQRESAVKAPTKRCPAVVKLETLIESLVGDRSLFVRQFLTSPKLEPLTRILRTNRAIISSSVNFCYTPAQETFRLETFESVSQIESSRFGKFKK